MPKICDPPPFKGGQMENAIYRLRATGFMVWADGFSYSVTSTSDNLFGKITNISISPLRQYSGFNFENYLVLIEVAHGGNPVPTIGTGLQWSNPYANWHGEMISWQITEIELFLPFGGDDMGGDPPGTNCRCSDDSCRVDCANAPDGFCCIDHALTNRLLRVLQN